MSKLSEKMMQARNLQPEKIIKPEGPVIRSAPAFQHHEEKARFAAEFALEAATQELDDLKRGLLPISELHEVEGRKRKLSDEDFAQLKANLRSNPLVNPVVVRPREEGGYEIISGHNRVQAYRELGRSEIEAQIREFKNEQVLEASFYSNLIASPLTDFEKFIGFRDIQKITGETQKELAVRAGVSETQMSFIFSFGQLPESALELLAKKPGSLGYKSAQKIKDLLSNKGGPSDDEVTHAIELLVNGTISTEKEAIDSLIKKAPKAETTVVDVRVGKKIFARISHRANIVAVDFKGTCLVNEFKVELEDLIKKYANLLGKS